MTTTVTALSLDERQAAVSARRQAAAEDVAGLRARVASLTSTRAAALAAADFDAAEEAAAELVELEAQIAPAAALVDELAGVVQVLATERQRGELTAQIEELDAARAAAVAAENAAVERITSLLGEVRAELRAARAAGQQAHHAHDQAETARFMLDHPEGGDRGYVPRVNGLRLEVLAEEQYRLIAVLEGRV